MILTLIAVAFIAAVLGFGAALLHFGVGRRDRPEGWEDARVARSNNSAWQAAWRKGRDWLDRHEVEELELQSDDGFILHGLLVPHVSPRATVLLFHGWQSSAEMDFLCLLPFLHEQRLQCILIDQRAQGDSEGRYMTLGVRERLDVPLWVEYAANRFGETHPIFLQGLSMGAATVLMASSTEFAGNVCGVIADCGFTTPHEAASFVWRSKTPFPAGFAIWLMDRFARLFADFSLKECSALDEVRRTKYPVLFIHGTADKFVPSYMTKRMYEACKSDKMLLLVDGAGHCMSYLTDRAGYESAYRQFVEKCLEQ